MSKLFVNKRLSRVLNKVSPPAMVVFYFPNQKSPEGDLVLVVAEVGANWHQVVGFLREVEKAKLCGQVARHMIYFVSKRK